MSAGVSSDIDRQLQRLSFSPDVVRGRPGPGNKEHGGQTRRRREQPQGPHRPPAGPRDLVQRRRIDEAAEVLALLAHFEQVPLQLQVGRMTHAALRSRYLRAFSKNRANLRDTVFREMPNASATSSCSIPSTSTPTAIDCVLESNRASTRCTSRRWGKSGCSDATSRSINSDRSEEHTSELQS